MVQAVLNKNRVEINLDMFDKQLEFHAKVQKTRWTGFFGGAGSGKTTGGAMESIYQVVKHPGPPLLIVAPTFPMLERVTQRKFLEILPRELIADYNKAKRHIDLVNGTPIDFCSTQNPDSLYGSSVGRIWIDEGPLIPDKAFDILVGRLREGPEKLQRGWVDGTPKGLNWAHREFCTGKANRDGIFEVSSADNPYAADAFLEDLRSTLTGQFKDQEYYGQFVKFEGLIYAMIEDGTHYLERPLQEMVRFAAGVDWGYEHPWVFVVAGQDGEGRWHIFEELYQTHLTTDGQIEAVLDLMRRYSLEAVYCPDDRPENIEAYGNAGIPAVSYKRDVVQGVPCVAQAMAVGPDGKAKCTFSASAPRTYAECKSYQWKTRPEGVSGKEEPLKIKDDGPDAVRSLIHGDHQAGGGDEDEIILLGSGWTTPGGAN